MNTLVDQPDLSPKYQFNHRTLGYIAASSKEEMGEGRLLLTLYSDHYFYRVDIGLADGTQVEVFESDLKPYGEFWL